MANSDGVGRGSGRVPVGVLLLYAARWRGGRHGGLHRLGATRAAVIERIVDHQPLSRGWALGTTVGVSGVLALALAHPGQLGPAATTATAQPVLGIALGLLAGFTYAIYSWGAVRVMRCGLPSRPVMGAVFGLGGILLLPVLALTGAPIITSGSNLAVAAYLAIVPMFLGYVLFGCGLATVAASTATTVSLLEPAVAALIAVIVLGEHLPPIGWLGLGLLFASLLITATNTRPTATSHHGHQPTGAPNRAVSATVNADVEPA